jgi:hypothetical protein
MRAINAPIFKVAAAVGIATIGFVAWLWVRNPPAPVAESPAPPPSAQQPPSTAPAAPEARHPIAQAQGDPYASSATPLPPLDASDDAARAALAKLFEGDVIDRIFNLDGFARRVVATIDNLPRRDVAPRVMALRPAPGSLAISEGSDGVVLDAGNAARYEPYLRALSSVDSGQLVGVYVHFYPVLQQAYRDLGYPNAYFNDRVIEVIDHLLATPEVRTPVRLEQPRVLYTFADPELEKLSAGQKALVRMGPDASARTKARLREIRSRLVPLSR